MVEWWCDTFITLRHSLGLLLFHSHRHHRHTSPQVPIFSNPASFANPTKAPIWLDEQRLVDALAGTEYMFNYEFFRAEKVHRHCVGLVQKKSQLSLASHSPDLTPPLKAESSFQLPNMVRESTLGVPVGVHTYLNNRTEDPGTHLFAFMVLRQEHWWQMRQHTDAPSHLASQPFTPLHSHLHPFTHPVSDPHPQGTPLLAQAGSTVIGRRHPFLSSSANVDVLWTMPPRGCHPWCILGDMSTVGSPSTAQSPHTATRIGNACDASVRFVFMRIIRVLEGNVSNKNIIGPAVESIFVFCPSTRPHLSALHTLYYVTTFLVLGIWSHITIASRDLIIFRMLCIEYGWVSIIWLRNSLYDWFLKICLTYIPTCPIRIVATSFPAPMILSYLLSFTEGKRKLRHWLPLSRRWT